MLSPEQLSNLHLQQVITTTVFETSQTKQSLLQTLAEMKAKKQHYIMIPSFFFLINVYY